MKGEKAWAQHSAQLGGLGTPPRPNGYASLIEVKQEDDVGKDTKVGIEFSSYRLLAIHSAHGGAATEYKI